MKAAAITFMIGLISLLVWLYITSADGTAFSLLRKAAWYFLVVPLLVGIATMIPAGIFAGLGGTDLSFWPFLAYVIVYPLYEEILKSWASRATNGGVQAFALVSLFGIFELMLSKPFAMASGGSPDGIPLIWDVSLTIPALFMHILTAAIYAFWLRDRPPIAFVICATIHAVFNSLTNDWPFPALTEEAFLLLIVPLLAATIALFPRKGSTRRGVWGDPALPVDSAAET